MPLERLAYTRGGADHAIESTIALEERGQGTMVLFPTRAALRLAIARDRADEGGRQTLGRLAALCEAQQQAQQQ